MRIVLDTNVFIAALLKSGLAREIIEIAKSREILTLVTSEDILAELRRKLLSKFDRSESDVDLFLEKIRGISEIVEIREKVWLITRDPDDNKILECAVSGGANLIVSADQDLIVLKRFRGIGIVHPKTLGWVLPEYFKKKKS